MCGDVDLMF